jgi:hypothetical protein
LHADLLVVAGWICPTARTWIADHSTVYGVLGSRP